MNFFSRLFSRTQHMSTSEQHGRAPLYFYNTLGKEVQEFTLPAAAHEVRMYNCGPTVYGPQHIGNLSMFVFTDILRRTLEYNGFAVRQVINFTDFGHLTSDADEGEDKMTKGLKRDGMKPTMENMKALGEKYAGIFLGDIAQLGIDTSRIQFPRASDYVPAQIAMIKTLEEKGYAYRAEDGMYFDTVRYPRYGELGGIDLEGLKEGARVAKNSAKRNPSDFALWKFDKKMGWDSPWGKGFPGWHIECSAMINSCLGKQIDIHTGGIEHIPVHHNNEIAQSECATGKHPMSRFWMHRAHLQLEGAKIAKSVGNVVFLADIIEKGFHPMALRYLLLGAHYRSSSNFTWEALEASQSALTKLLAKRLAIKDAPGETPLKWREKFTECINDDLDTPGALAVLWEMTKDDSIAPADLLAGFIEFDEVLGIGVADPDADLKQLAASQFKQQLSPAEIPSEVRELITEREAARTKRHFEKADELRTQIESAGYTLDDSPEGTKVYRQ